MKYLKSYNESIRDKMKPKPDEDIRLALSKLPIYDRIKKIKSSGLDDKYFPTDDEIKEYLSDFGVYDKIRTINELKFDEKFLPPDDEIMEYLSEFDVYDKISTINAFNLNDKFLPSDDEIMEYLSVLDIEDWVNAVYELDLDKSEFNPPDEKVLEYILPSNITYNSENNTLEFTEWSDFADLFKKDRDVRDEFIGDLLSGMGYEYFQHYDIIEPDYFNFSDEKIFQDVKSQIKEKIDELDLSDEDEYDEMVKDFDSAKSFRDLYDDVLKEYNILEDVKDAIDRAYTNAQESADESEAYNSFIKSITNKFSGGEVTYDNDKKLYVMPITIPNLDADNIIEDSKIIEWSAPYNGWYGSVDDDTFREELVNKLYEI